MAEVTELITRFSFSGSTRPLEDYNGSLGKGIGLLAGMTAALGVAVVGINKWVAGVSQSLQPLIELNAQTGVAVEKIQELSFIAEQSSSSTEALYSSISGLGAKIGEAAQKGSEDFSRLGVSVRNANGSVKDTDVVLSEVGNRFKQLGLSMNEQQGFAEALGIDPSLLSMMNKTGAEMASLRGEAQRLGVLTADQVKSAQDYNDALGALGFGMESVKRFIAVGLAPELTDLTKDFTDLLAANKDWIIDGIKATVGVLRDMVDALIRLAPFILAVGLAFGAAQLATLIFAGTLTLATAPIWLIALGIGALLLIFDDLIVAFRGGKSVIRDWVLEFSGFDITPLLKEIVEGFKEVGETLKNFGVGVFESWASIFSGIGDMLAGNFSDGFDKIGEGFSTMVDTWGELFRNVFGGIFDWAKNAALDILPDWAVNIIGGAGDAASGAASAVGDLASDAGGFISGLFNGGESDMPMAQPSQAMQPGGGRGNTVGQYSAVEQIVNMEIRTSDPEKAGKAASDGLQRHLEDARNQTRGRMSR